MHRRRFAATIVAAYLVVQFSSAAAAPSPGVQVLYAEPVAISFEGDTDKSTSAGGKSASSVGASSVGTATANRTARFNAFGRSFVVNMELHTELNAVAKRMGASALALRGTIAGQQASWVRLTQVGEKLHGLMWDGHELLVIGPASELPNANAANSNGPSSNAAIGASTIIFRLADTKIDAHANTCAALTATDNNSGAVLYQNLNRELKSTLGVAAQSSDQQSTQAEVTKRLQISSLMDTEYLSLYASKADAIDAVVARINNADGIFSAQLGIHIELAYTGAADADNNGALSASSAPNDLLQSLSQVRAASASLYGTGVTHLFTGRDLDGRTIGISYVGAMCSQRYGVALSEAHSGSTWYESLIVAHELGHSFGAGHDGEGDCASVPNTFLMAPMIGGADQFSQCSLDRMQQQITQATCLLPILKSDFAMAANLGLRHAAVAEIFDWTMAVTDLGDAGVANAKVQIAVPAELTVHSATVDNGHCIAGAGVVECDLGQVDAHTLRVITLSLSAALTGTYPIGATLTSSMDASAANNSGQGSIVIESQLPPIASATPTDALVSTTPQPASQGGGPMECGWLFGLAALLGWRRRYSKGEYGVR